MGRDDGPERSARSCTASYQGPIERWPRSVVDKTLRASSDLSLWLVLAPSSYPLPFVSHIETVALFSPRSTLSLNSVITLVDQALPGSCFNQPVQHSPVPVPLNEQASSPSFSKPVPTLYHNIILSLSPYQTSKTASLSCMCFDGYQHINSATYMYS